MAAARWIVSDELWGLVEPLLPTRKRRFRNPGWRTILVAVFFPCGFPSQPRGLQHCNQRLLS